jgi:hypothetical protein
MLLSKSIAITILFSALAVVQGAPVSVESTAITLGTRGEIVEIYARGKNGVFLEVDFCIPN